MGEKFNAVGGGEDFERLIERSQAGPVLIFKHSTTCPISASAYKEMSRVASEVALVVVQQARALSNDIAARTASATSAAGVSPNGEPSEGIPLTSPPTPSSAPCATTPEESGVRQ